MCAQSATSTRGIRVPGSLRKAIEDEAQRHGRSWSATATEILEEGIRIRRVPGIAFMNGAAGRRAVIAGTALGVWELIAVWREAVGDYENLAANFPWLSPMQLNAALGYYALYPEEIDRRLEVEDAWTEDRIRQEFPYLTPRAKPATSK